MKASNLHDLWESPDNTRLTSKQFSFRLPTHIAAKIAALCELFPNKTRTQIVADLLTSALDELEEGLPQALGDEIEPSSQEDANWMSSPEYEPTFYLGGLRGRFRNIVNRHHFDIEKEQGNENPKALYTNLLVTKSDIEKD